MSRRASRKVKKLNTQKKGILNADELKAYNDAYSGESARTLKIKNILAPGMILAAFSFVQLFNILYSTVFALIGIWFGWKILYPRAVKRNYEEAAFMERNQWINMMVLLLTDNSTTVPKALEEVIDIAEGEFSEDLRILYAELMKSNEKGTAEAFKYFSRKYVNDVHFMQFVEQLETAAIEGKTNVETLKDIKSYHNQMNKEQRENRNDRKRHFQSMQQLMLLIGTVLLAIPLLGIGIETYIEVHTKNIVGIMTSTIFLICEIKFSFDYMKELTDDNIMELKV